MESFSVTTHLTSKSYAKVIIIGLYKRPISILYSLVGLFILTSILLDYFTVIYFYPNAPYLLFAVSIFILLSPLLIASIPVRQFQSNPCFQNEIKYTFSDNGVYFQGPTFKAEYLWSHIIKEREINNYLILYHSTNIWNLVYNTKLTVEQLQFIREKAGKK